MAVHKLVLDDFVTVDYGLIAIYSPLEDYRLAYFINRELGLRLEKDANIGFKVKQGEGFFTRYSYIDENTDCAWNLVQNKKGVSSVSAAGSLFKDESQMFTATVYLMPELKKVDYILKVEGMPENTVPKGTLEKLLSLQHITTAYIQDTDKLKHKNNLIF